MTDENKKPPTAPAAPKADEKKKEKPLPMPKTGGRFTRNKATGELTDVTPKPKPEPKTDEAEK